MPLLGKIFHSVKGKSVTDGRDLKHRELGLKIWGFRMGIGCYLRQKKLYKLLSDSEHISKINISHSSTTPPSPDPSLADSQWAQTEALWTGKRQASGKPKDNCLLHFGSENPILEAMGEATKHSLYTISKANIRSDYTCPSLPLQPHRLRHTVLGSTGAFSEPLYSGEEQTIPLNSSVFWDQAQPLYDSVNLF